MIGRIEDFVEQLLNQECEALQLNKTQYDSAVEKYTAVGKWLGGAGSPLERFTTRIYPQGSMALGTTVRPVDEGEYDLDLIFEVAAARLSPNELHQVIKRRLCESDLYAPRLVDPCPPRCIRIAYAGDFHLDIVPARSASNGTGTAIEVPDRELRCWIWNDPKEYSKWFESRCRYLLEKAEIEAVPSRLSSAMKPPLKRIVQLWKRQRDIVFGDAKGAPTSILLTTLAGNFYEADTRTFDALLKVLSLTERNIWSAWPNRIKVNNPTNSSEDLCGRFSDLQYKEFAAWVGSFNKSMAKLTNIRGFEEIASVLEVLFGERLTRRVVKSFMEEMARQRTSGNLRYRGSGLITSRVRKNFG